MGAFLMLKIIAVTFIATLIGGLAWAQPFYVGFWVQDPAACISPEYMLEISETTLFDYEDTCELSNPVDIRNMNGVLFDTNCDGEGGKTTERLLITTEGENMIMLHQFNGTRIFQTCE